MTARRALPALVDRPHDKRLAPAHIARSEHFVHVGFIAARAIGCRTGVAAPIFFNAERVQHFLRRADEAHRQQHQIGFDFEFAAGR